MDNTLAAYFPRSGPISFLGEKRHITGAGISFLIHLFGVCAIVFFSSNISSFKPPLTIDFSIEESFGPKKVQKQVPVQKPVPKKPKVVKTEKIVPVAKKTQVVPREEIPVPVEPVAIPKLPEIAEVVEEPVEEVEPVVEEVEPAQPLVTEEFSIPEEPPAAGPVVSRTHSPRQKKERYMKEHFQYIQDSVQGKITYPRMARKMGWQGRVLISFVICKDGSVKDIKIVESSGFKALDKNAVDAIRKEAPFPVPPVAAELLIPVVYKLS